MLVRKPCIRLSHVAPPCTRRIRAHGKSSGFADDDVDGDGMSYWSRWMAKTTEEGKKTQPSAVEKTPLPLTSAAVTVARPLDFSWWGSLPRVHYISFGSRIGLLPIIELPSSDGLAIALSSSQYTGILPAMLAAYGEKSTTCLVAFEDRSDAEFVAATLRINLEASSLSSMAEKDGEDFLRESTPKVLSASPLFLKDVAGTRSAVLGVVPRDVISRKVQLSDQALQDLLAQILVSDRSVSSAVVQPTIVDEVLRSPPPSSMTVPPNFTEKSSGSTVSKQGNIKFEFSGFKPPSASVKVKQKEGEIMPMEKKVDPMVDPQPSQPPSPSASSSGSLDENDFEAQLRILDALDEKARELQDRAQKKAQAVSPSSEAELDIETASRLPPTSKLLLKLLEQSMNPVSPRKKTVGADPLDEGSPRSQQSREDTLEDKEKDALLSEWYSLASKMKRKTSASPPSPSAPLSRPQDPEVMPSSSSMSINKEEEDAYVNAVLSNLEVVAAKVKEAERRTAEAARRAKSGDAAAAVARTSAESQLEALREQMEQLVLLRDSLIGLNEEEEQRRRDAAEGDQSGDLIQEAEIVSSFEEKVPSSIPPPMTSEGRLPSPSVIKPPISEGDKKSWGSAWGKNRRIQAAGVSLLSKPSFVSSIPSPSDPSSPESKPSQPLQIPLVAPPSQKEEQEEEEGLVSSIVSKRAGKERAPKVERTPEEKQAIVKDALRFAAASDEEEVGGGQSTWWKNRFQALWLPTLLYADGSLGFVQIDVSLTEGRKDVRVIAFEDSNDATCCMAVLKQWPEYDWVNMSVSCLPTSTIEDSIQRAFTEQVENESKRVSPPSGLCVFRRGKLAMKVGMSMEEMTRSVVYQAAAQKSLSRIGYEFDS